jgi:type IV pilus assembly protein PilC
MVNFAYKGIDTNGKRIEGSIGASTIEEAERKLSIQDVSILSLRVDSKGKTKASEDRGVTRTSSSRKKIAAQDSADILRSLAIMAETGVPFVEALDSVKESARTPAIQASLDDVKQAVIAGQGLSSALRAAPNMFPTIIVDMIRVAETGGRLEQALDNGASYMERAAELRRKIINAMMYPMVMMGVSAGTILVMIVFVMPKFSQMFKTMKAEVPVTTKIMLAMGNVIRASPIVSLATFIGMIFLITYLLKLEPVKKVISLIANKTPILGDLLKRLALARSLQSIATLASSNVPLLAAIEHGAKVAGHRQISKALTTARDEIERGKSMSEALSATGVFPKKITQMVAVGERTGRLPQLLTTVSTSMESEVDAKLKALVSIIEPLMIVSMGLIVGSITLSIIGPIYSVVENVK